MSKVARKVMTGMILAGSAALFASSSFGAMTPQEVIDNMERAYEKRMKEIQDFTIVQENVGGMGAFAGETIIYQKRAEVGGKTIYKTRSETKMMGRSVVTIYDGEYNWSVDPISGGVEKEEAERDPGQIWRNIDPSQTHYLGEEEIEGKTTHVLKIDDPFKVLGRRQSPRPGMQPDHQQTPPVEEGMGRRQSPRPGMQPDHQQTPPAGERLDRPQALPPREQEDVGEIEAEGQLWISDKTWMPVRTLITTRSKSVEEGKETITTWKMTTDYKDYRRLGLLLTPCRIVVNTTIDVPSLGEEERRQMGMMRQFMGGMGSFEVEVTEVKVNTGLSDDLFDPTKL